MKDVKQSVAELACKEKYNYDDLIEIMRILRSDAGCPWDREQTHHSVRMALLEEAYEVAEGVDGQDSELMKEELGDLMFQIIFHARLEEEKGNFTMQDVCDGISRKMINRHPHVFGEEKVDGTDNVLENWEQIKNKEKKRVSVTSRLRAVPSTFPALMQAQKIGSRAAKVNFDFPDAESACEKIYEEIEEIRGVSDADNLFEECGDLLFAVTNYVRKLGINAEEALLFANSKFVDRFESVENLVTESGKDMCKMNIKELDELWDGVKITKKVCKS